MRLRVGRMQGPITRILGKEARLQLSGVRMRLQSFTLQNVKLKEISFCPMYVAGQIAKTNVVRMRLGYYNLGTEFCSVGDVTSGSRILFTIHS